MAQKQEQFQDLLRERRLGKEDVKGLYSRVQKIGRSLVYPCSKESSGDFIVRNVSMNIDTWP